MVSADAYLDVAGARLRFRADGAGPAVLLIHGWALDLESWEPQVPALARRYRVIRVDRRGFGLSTGAPSLERDAEDVHALLEHLGVQRAALLGASQGARVAFRALFAAPPRVACMILDGPPELLAPGGGLAPEEIPLGIYRRLARQGDMPSVRRLWSCHPFTQLTSTDRSARRHLACLLARYPGTDLLLPAVAQPPLSRAALRSLRLPVLIINGERDLEARHAAGVALSRAIPSATRTVIANAGHLPNLDSPASYAQVVDDFLAMSFAADAG
jgi:pimeloyl-ACP methyl ester carboxylesterase